MNKILLIFVIFFLFLSCAEQKEEIVATVNEEHLTLDEFRSFFSETEWNELDYETKREHINEWIKLTLLAQEVDNSELSNDPAVKERIKTAVKNVKANLLIAHKIAEIEITEDDLFNYYKLHKSKYQQKKKEFKIQRIFIKEKAKLDSVMTYLRQGEPFTDIVKKYSEETLGESGGYTGFMGEKDLDSIIWNKLNSLQKWHYTSAEVKDGYYIFRYYDTQEVVLNKEFTEVEAEIRKIVLEQKKQDVFQNIVEELKRKADISISL